MSRYFGLFKRNLAMNLESEMAYKANFIIKSFSLVIGDLVAPLLILLIYTATSGIPGWSLHEFILFQGILTTVFAMNRTFLVAIPFKVIENVREGTFDKILIKPYNPLLYLTATSADADGFAEILVGVGLIVFASVNLGVSFIGLNGLAFIILLILGLLFLYSIMILIGSLSFIVVKSYALFDIFFRLTDFSRYPLSIYSFWTQVTLTFFFPVAVSAYYPASFLLGHMAFGNLFVIGAPVLIFLGIAILVWNVAITKYTSAGG